VGTMIRDTDRVVEMVRKGTPAHAMQRDHEE
jgi:hypothetical protein